MKLLHKLQSPEVQPASLILLAGLLLVLFPHYAHLPPWLSLVTTALVFWRACYDLIICAIPGKKVLFLLMLMLLAGILYSYHTLIGRNAGSAMLLGLLCLKLLEIHSFRDIAIIINLALFSIVINFLFSQTIPVAVIMLFALFFIFSALIGFQHDYKKRKPAALIPLSTIYLNEKNHFKLAIKMLLQALPFAIVLFMLFPRVNGPLWGLPEDAFSGKTGLTDQMSPGRISQLSNDSSVAFRVKFNSKPPPSIQLYWRGPVMWHFDGYNWTAPANERIALRNYSFQALRQPVSYTITLEPHNNYWLFALDMPSTIPGNARLSADMQVLSLRPVEKLRRYELTSYTRYILPTYSQFNMEKYLRVPASSSPRARKLMQRLQDKNNNENSIANVLNYFATQDFYYTRNAPLLFDQPIDEFLFDSKRGYCEHYASSFAILMRLAGIPSRVVTGYQGGELNPLDGYMTLRQSDAHAWVEVYLTEKGWVRIDPTAAIPPGNIENAADARRLNSSQQKPSRIFESSWLSKSLKRARFAWDAVNNRWNQWVLGYDNNSQKALFKAIGIPEISWQGLSQLLFSILGILTGLLALLVFKKNRNHQDEVQKLYQLFLRKLKKQGLSKHHAEGANDFAKRAILKLPGQKSSIEQISQLYQQCRYNKPQAHTINSLKQAITTFHKKNV